MNLVSNKEWIWNEIDWELRLMSRIGGFDAFYTAVDVSVYDFDDYTNWIHSFMLTSCWHRN